MTSLLSLPCEILHHILLEVEPPQLAALSQSCRTLHSYISGNALLAKQIYLRHWDSPVIQKGRKWTEELHNVIRLSKLLHSIDRDLQFDELPFISETVCSLLSSISLTTDADSRNVAFLACHFTRSDPKSSSPTRRQAVNLLRSSGLFDRIGKDSSDIYRGAPNDDLRQLSAKLHVHYGIDNPWGDALALAHPYARSRVYDLRYYNDASLWGPFTEDGSVQVDWEKIEAIMIDLAYNMRLFSERWSGAVPPYSCPPFYGANPHSYASPPSKIPKSIRVPLADKDPYGITGTWRRVVCFLDYSDLHAFNFSGSRIRPGPQPRAPIHTEEVIRMIMLSLRVVKIEPPGPDDGQALPVVYFTGNSKSVHTHWDPNANSRIRGSVRLTPHGDVRWTTVSVFFGEERWKSEGIQVGGIRSARGVWGTWFDKDYDPEGPAGPTAFWKVSDDVDPRFGKVDEDEPLWNF